jgi:hypothetical protein
MADGDWSDSSSGGSSSRRKGRSGSSSSSSGGGDPYSILTVLRGALSGGGGSKSDVRPVSYKHGGKVKRTGEAHVHRGELVIPAGKVRQLKKALGRMKKRNGRKSSGRA